MSQPTGDLNTTISHFCSVVVKNRWWILVTACAVSLATIRYSYMIPNKYRSEATIFMSKPTVQQQYVLPNNTVTALDALDAVRREGLSRARLEHIIEEYDLYPDKRQLGAAALTDLMRGDIEVQPISKDPERRAMNAFIIAFTGTDPSVAQQVTGRLTSLLIDENLRKQKEMNMGTTDFLHQQVVAAKVELDRQDAIVRDYTVQNLGDLPEQSAGNIEVLSGLQIQLQTVESNIARARQERTYLQAMLSHYAPSGTGQGTTLPGSELALQQELTKLRNQREDLLSRYSPRYPDVIALNQQIEDDETQLRRLVEERKATAEQGKSAGSNDAAFPADPAAIQLRSQLEANAMEIDDAQKQSKVLAAKIASYQGRLTEAPVREHQFAEIQQSYNIAKENYTNLLSKENQSQLATKLQVQQVNDQYQVIDSASLPLHPISPNRQKIALGGLAGGAVLGLGIALLLDARDRSFQSEDDVRRFLPIPIVVGIPPLRTPTERRNLARRASLEWVLGSVLVIVLLGAQLFVYRHG